MKKMRNYDALLKAVRIIFSFLFQSDIKNRIIRNTFITVLDLDVYENLSF